MNRRLHHQTLRELDRLVWKKPGNNAITKMIEHVMELDKRSDTGELVVLFNELLQSKYFNRRPPENKSLTPLIDLRKNLSGFFGATFKNTYQFAAFTLLANSGCSREETDRIEEVLSQLKPAFIQIERGDDWQRQNEDAALNEDTQSDPNIEIQLCFECTPDHVLRSESIANYEHFVQLFEQRDYFEQGVKVVEYFMDDPFEEIPEVVLRNYFSPGMAGRLSNTHPDHPFLTNWIRWVNDHGSNGRFGRSTFLDYMSEDDRNNPDIVRSFVRHNGLELEHASEPLKRDPSIVSQAVSKNGRALEHAHDSLKRHPEIVRLALENDPTAIQWADMNCLEWDSYLSYFQAALKKNGRIAKRMDPALYRTTQELLDLAVLVEPGVLKHGSNTYRSSSEKARQILPMSPMALQYFDEAIRSNIEFVLLAIQQDALALEFATIELRREEALIEVALTGNKKSFVFIPKDLQLPEQGTLLRWISLQPLLVLHFDLLDKGPFNELIQSAYISASLPLKNEDILSLPEPAENQGQQVDIDDLF